MKANWFSPLPPTKSGIATYTASVLPVLTRQMDVTLWTDQTEWDSSLEEWAPVRKYAPSALPWSALNRADLSFFHIGNHPGYHAAIWEVSRAHPGVVVLHDLSLQHLFAAMFLEHWRDREGFLARMEHEYGPDGVRDALAFLREEVTTEYLGAHYPLTGLAVERAAGVVVHSQVAWDAVRCDGSSPVIYAPLPYQCETGRPNRSDDRGRPPYRIVMFGFIAPNRALDTVLQALAGLPERALFRFDIYGELWNRSEVENGIRSLALDDRVSLRGFVDDTELSEALRDADVAVNLRQPTMGEASLSQLQLWGAGVPTLVSRVGWYAEAPEDAVAFVRSDRAIEDIQSHLRSLAQDPRSFRAIGARGYDHLRAHHSPGRYVSALASFGSEARRYRAGITAIDLAERAGRAISPWSGNGVSQDFYRRAAERIHSLFLGDGARS